MPTPPVYTPTTRFNNVQSLYENHFRFVVERLPDLSQYTQAVGVPSVSVSSTDRANPFVNIREVGDHFTYGMMDVSFSMDAEFKVYNSLFWWMKGYGFPHSWDEVKDFRERMQQRLTVPARRTIARDVEKTNAVLYVLTPDTESTLMEFHFTDLFPIGLSGLQFATTTTDAPVLKCSAQMAFTDFDIFPPS